MKYEQQKEACEKYAQQEGRTVADVIRVSGNRGAVVLSKDGRTIFDPFVIDAIKEVVVEPKVEPIVEPRQEPPVEGVKVEKPAAPKKKPTQRRKK